MTARERAASGLLVAGVLSLGAVLAADRAPGSVEGAVEVRKQGGHPPMVVSLEAPGLLVQPPPEPVPVDQKGFQFVPRLVTVVRGTTVRFLNGDPEPHNVYSPDGRYDLGTWRRGETRDHLFDTPGAYTQRCSLHPEMLAHVVVLDTPYFAQTDGEGRFRITGVAPGVYKLVVWSSKLDGLEREVKVEEGKALRLPLVVER